MKKVIFNSLLASLVSINLHSKTTFTKTQSIALPLPGGDAPYNITSGLVDNDSYIDLVISTTIGDKVYWLKNDGTGNFTIQFPAIGT